MTSRGYTLIELLVSVAIFSLVMLFVTTAYLSLIAATRHARATSTLMTNIDTAVDFMARSIRTGTNYTCSPISGPNNDCSAATQFTFTDETGATVTYLVTSSGALGECPTGGACDASSAFPLTDPSITISGRCGECGVSEIRTP